MVHIRWFDSSLEGREHRVARCYALAMGGLGSMAFTASEWLTMTLDTSLLIAVALMVAGRYVGTGYRLMYRVIRKSMSLTKLLRLLLPSAPFALSGTLSWCVAIGLADWDTLMGLTKVLAQAYIPFA